MLLLSRASLQATPSFVSSAAQARRGAASSSSSATASLASTSRIANARSLVASTRRQVQQRRARASAAARSRGSLVVEANELNKWCVPERVEIAREGGFGEHRCQEENILKEQFFSSKCPRAFSVGPCSSAPSLLSHPPCFFVLFLCSYPLSHRANRDAFDDTEGENEDDYSFDR